MYPAISRRAAVAQVLAFFPIILLAVYYISIYLDSVVGTILAIAVIVILLFLVPKGVRYLTSGNARIDSTGAFIMAILGFFNASYITVFTWLIPIFDILSSADEKFYTLLVVTWFSWGILQMVVGLLIRMDKVQRSEHLIS